MNCVTFDGRPLGPLAVPYIENDIEFICTDLDVVPPEFPGTTTGLRLPRETDLHVTLFMLCRAATLQVLARSPVTVTASDNHHVPVCPVQNLPASPAVLQRIAFADPEGRIRRLHLRSPENGVILIDVCVEPA